ncbi:MAG: GAF domain-containing sensor histidine kinase [Gemmatimonadaceae bacterium]
MTPNILDADRLAAVHGTGLLDTEAEEVFDRLTRLAVRLVGIPAAFISLVDENRDFYKSACGFGEPLATTRELSGPTFCHYTVQRSAPLVIPDTAADPEYRDVPTVKTLGVAAYVGVPLIVDGQTVGAFCAIDIKPHQWTDGEVEVLTELAASAQREIELRGALADAEQARSEAEAANRVKAEFLAVMSHELRTPLNAIGGYADLIDVGVHGPVTEGQRGALERIKRSQVHLLGLINGLLIYAQLDAGAVSFEIEDVDLDAVIATCEALTAPQMKAKEIEIAYSPAKHGIQVQADREKLHQIVINLLSNAVKFTDDKGTINVSTHTDEANKLRIEFADTGRGIERDHFERIFDPFVQVDAKLTRATEGTGLGLSISRSLARGMGGDISVSSTYGVGSTFILSLPTQ